MHTPLRISLEDVACRVMTYSHTHTFEKQKDKDIYIAVHQLMRGEARVEKVGRERETFFGHGILGWCFGRCPLEDFLFGAMGFGRRFDTRVYKSVTKCSRELQPLRKYWLFEFLRFSNNYCCAQYTYNLQYSSTASRYCARVLEFEF